MGLKVKREVVCIHAMFWRLAHGWLKTWANLPSFIISIAFLCYWCYFNRLYRLLCLCSSYLCWWWWTYYRCLLWWCFHWIVRALNKALQPINWLGPLSKVKLLVQPSTLSYLLGGGPNLVWHISNSWPEEIHFFMKESGHFQNKKEGSFRGKKRSKTVGWGMKLLDHRAAINRKIARP